MQFLQPYLLKGEPQYANVSVKEGLHTVVRPQRDSVYCPGPVMEHPTLLLSLKYQNKQQLSNKKTEQTDQCHVQNNAVGVSQVTSIWAFLVCRVYLTWSCHTQRSG